MLSTLTKKFSQVLSATSRLPNSFSFTTCQPLSKESPQIDEKIKRNISQRLNSQQFTTLKEEIFESKDPSYLNTHVLRHIILKSIQKSNTSFANEILEEMNSRNITPDDATYTTVIEAHLADGYTEDAYELYIQAYLHGVILDLEIFYSLYERLEKRDISYLHMAYTILKSTLEPSKYIMDHLLHTATKTKSKEFLEILYKDLEKYNIELIETAKFNKEPRTSTAKKSKRGSRSKNSKGQNVVVLPFDPSLKHNKRGMSKDSLAFLEELTAAMGNARGMDDDDDEEFDSDDSDDLGSDGAKEDFTSSDEE